MNSSVSVESEWSDEDVEDGKAIGVLTEDDDLIICTSVENTLSSSNTEPANKISSHSVENSSLGVKNAPVNIKRNNIRPPKVKRSEESPKRLLKSIADIENSEDSDGLDVEDDLSSLSSVSEYAESENSDDLAFDGFHSGAPHSSTDCEFEGFGHARTQCNPGASTASVNKQPCDKNNPKNFGLNGKQKDETYYTFEGFDPFNSSGKNFKATESVKESRGVRMQDFPYQHKILEAQPKVFHSKHTKNVSAMSSPTKVKLEPENDDFIGPNCQAIGCTVSWLETGFSMEEPAHVSNGMVFELSEFAKKIAWEREYVVRWIYRIRGLPSESIPVSDEDLKKIHMVIKRRKAISVTFSGKNLLKVKLAAFDKEIFHLPSLEHQKNDVPKSVKTNTKLRIGEVHNSTTAENSFVDPVSNLQMAKMLMASNNSVPSQKSSFRDSLTSEGESSHSDSELMIDEDMCSKDGYSRLSHLEKTSKFPVTGPFSSKAHVQEHVMDKKLPQDLSSSKASIDIDSYNAKRNESFPNGNKKLQGVKNPLISESSSVVKNNANPQSLGSCGKVVTAVAANDKKLDSGKVSFGQHIKFASKKGKGDFAGKNVQYPVFEIRDNVIGPYCNRAELSVKMLNAPSKTILMTNGMIIELYIFFKERGATLTSLVYKIHQLTNTLVNGSLIQLDMFRVQEVVNTELHKKTEYFLEKEFSFISPESGSTTQCVVKTEEPPMQAMHSCMPSKNISHNLTNLPEQKDSSILDSSKHDSEADDDSDPTLDEVDASMLSDFEKSRGKQGAITRGDIVSLYYSWLQQKNKDKDSVFVIDLLNDVEKLMIKRGIEVVRIPVGTLMSSSVKLFDEYKAYRSASSEDALAYLEDDWLEDLNYLVSSSKSTKGLLEESIPCKDCKTNSSKVFSKNSKISLDKDGSCLCKKNVEKNVSMIGTKAVAEITSSSNKSNDSIMQEHSIQNVKEVISKSKSCKMVESSLSNRKKSTAAAIVRKPSHLPVKRAAEERNEGRLTKYPKSESTSSVIDKADVYPPLPVISSNQFTDLTFEFRIEKIVSCRLSSRNGLSVFDYLVQWKGNSPIPNTWVEEKDFPPGCTLIAKFWEDNSTKNMDVHEIKDHKKLEGGDGENCYLVTWHKYNSSSWIEEKHMPSLACKLLGQYKNLRMKGDQLPSSSPMNDIFSERDSPERDSDDGMVHSSEHTFQNVKSLEFMDLHPEKTDNCVLNSSVITENLSKANPEYSDECTVETNSSCRQVMNNMKRKNKIRFRSQLNGNLSSNQDDTSTDLETNGLSQNLAFKTKGGSVKSTDPLKSISNKLNKNLSSSSFSSENSAKLTSRRPPKHTTDNVSSSSERKFIRRPREELFSTTEKARKMQVLKTISLGQVLNQKECLQFSDLVAQCVSSNIAANSIFPANKPVRYLSNGKLLEIYGEWRKKKRSKDTDESLKSFNALRDNVKSLLESYELEYEYDNCLLGICYSLHLERAGLNSMADIMKFNSSPCIGAFKSFKANHDEILGKYYKPTSQIPYSRLNEKTSRYIDRYTLNQARSNSLFYDSARLKIKQGLLDVQEKLSISDAASEAIVEDVNELQQGLDYIEKKQQTLSFAINTYSKCVEKDKAKKTLKKFGFVGGDLKDLLSLVSQNMKP